MQIIDFHTHIFPDSLAARALAQLAEHAPGVAAHTNGTLAGLKDSMRKNGVTKSVLLPIATKPAQTGTINKTCGKIASPDCIPFGALHPAQENMEAELARLESLNVKGIKLHPEYQDFYIDAKRFFPMYDLLQSHDMIVVFHAGKDPGPFTCDHALPPAFRILHHNFPRLKMIAAHMGGWQVWQAVEQYLVDLPIFFDTAAVKDFLPRAEFVRLARRHGTERILFGTDSPWYDQGDNIRWLDSLPLRPEDKENIFYKNALNLLNS